MKTLAAIDSSGSAPEVLETARRLAALFVTQVEAVHVHEDGRRSPLAEAAAAGVRLHTSCGEPASGILRAINHNDVLMAVLGVGGDRQLRLGVGDVARDVMMHASKPIVLVPRNAKVLDATRAVKVVVPLDGARATEKALRDVLNRLADRDVDVVALHVMNSANAPQYWDRFYYDFPAWYERFRQDNCRRTTARLEVGRGPVVSEVLRLADGEEASLIAVAWSQVLDPGHARCVTDLLRSTRVPVLFVPTRMAAALPAPLLLTDAA